MLIRRNIKRLLARVLFRLLALVQKVLVHWRRAIEWMIGSTDRLGHFMASRLLSE